MSICLRVLEYFVEKHVKTLLDRDNQIDTVVLGCTHYPLILPVIQKFLPKYLIVAQGEIVANSLKDYLDRHKNLRNKCTKNGTIQYYILSQLKNSYVQHLYFYTKKLMQTYSLRKVN